MVDNLISGDLLCDKVQDQICQFQIMCLFNLISIQLQKCQTRGQSCTLVAINEWMPGCDGSDICSSHAKYII